MSKQQRVSDLCIYCQSLPDTERRERLPQQWSCINCGQQLWHLHRHHFAETFCSEQCEDVVYARRERRRAPSAMASWRVLHFLRRQLSTQAAGRRHDMQLGLPTTGIPQARYRSLDGWPHSIA